MSLLDRYLLREWLKMLGLVLAAVLGLLLVQAMYDDFLDLREKDAGASDIVAYFGVKLPSYLPLVLPLSMLVSLLYTLGTLHRNHEITAMRAAGLGLFRLTRSIWVAGLLACALSWWLGGTVVPWSVEESQSLLERLEFRRELTGAQTSGDIAGVGLEYSVAFDNARAGRMWFFNRYSRFTRRGYGVTISELDPQGREKVRWIAREAVLDRERGQWVLRHGREVWFDVEGGGEVMRTAPFEERAVPHLTEDPGLMLITDRKPSDLSLRELERLMAHHRAENSPKLARYAMRYWELQAATLAPLVVIVLAIPFAVAGVRVNPAVGVAKSLGLFAVFFLLVRLANGVGERELVPVWAAAFAPSVVMLGVGGWFFSRVR